MSARRSVPPVPQRDPLLRWSSRAIHGFALRADISGCDLRTRDQMRSNEMYDMYPEWGPAKNRHDDGYGEARAGVQSSFDRRDAYGERPDDN
jgi:hypothetical protein